MAVRMSVGVYVCAVFLARDGDLTDGPILIKFGMIAYWANTPRRFFHSLDFLIFPPFSPIKRKN